MHPFPPPPKKVRCYNGFLVYAYQELPDMLKICAVPIAARVKPLLDAIRRLPLMISDELYQ